MQSCGVVSSPSHLCGSRKPQPAPRESTSTASSWLWAWSAASSARILWMMSSLSLASSCSSKMLGCCQVHPSFPLLCPWSRCRVSRPTVSARGEITGICVLGAVVASRIVHFTCKKVAGRSGTATHPLSNTHVQHEHGNTGIWDAPSCKRERNILRARLCFIPLLSRRRSACGDKDGFDAGILRMRSSRPRSRAIGRP